MVLISKFSTIVKISNKMNREHINFVGFLIIFIFCVGTCPKTTDAESNKIDEIIVAELGGNATLLCNPLLRENSTLSSLATDFEWAYPYKNTSIRIFSNGKLWPYLFENDVDNSSFAIGSDPPGTLILRKINNFGANDTFTCTFSIPETKVSYTYFLQINENIRDGKRSDIYHRLNSRNRGTITLPCGDEQVTAPSSDLSYYWLSRKSKPDENVEDVEVVSLNRNIALRNNAKGFQVAENRSLIIIESPAPMVDTFFECHTSNGSIFQHYINLNPHYNEDFTVKNLKKQSFSVVYGTRNVVLPCPSSDNITNSSYVWFYFDSKSRTFDPDLLFVDQKKIAFNAKPSPDFYEIKDDGSLVILVVRKNQFGRYVCRRSTDEQYVYDLNQEYKNISETILIKDRSIITLPCPMEDQTDRDYHMIVWSIISKSNKLFGVNFIQVINGKMMMTNEYPDNVKLADDKTSLIVSNLTSSSIGAKYFCELIPSRTKYEYQLIK